MPVTRTYYIQAEFDIWNYAPAGRDRCARAAWLSEGQVLLFDLLRSSIAASLD